MQVVIEIDAEDLERIKARTNKSSSDFIILNGKPLPEKWRIIADDELEKMIVVRKNATNGDVFLKIFTQAEASVNDSLGERGTVFVYLGEDIIMIPLDIWNAPYKAESEDKE